MKRGIEDLSVSAQALIKTLLSENTALRIHVKNIRKATAKIETLVKENHAIYKQVIAKQQKEIDGLTETNAFLMKRVLTVDQPIKLTDDKPKEKPVLYTSHVQTDSVSTVERVLRELGIVDTDTREQDMLTVATEMLIKSNRRVEGEGIQ